MENKLLPSSGGLNAEALIRSGFVRKVYGILSVQLVITFGEIALFQFVNPLRAAICRPPFRMSPPTQATWNDPDYQDFARANGDCFTSTPPAKYSADADYTLGMNTTAMVLMYGSWAVGFALIIALACCMNNARVYPRNMILLGLFTLAQGTMLGTLCAFFQASAVLLAVAMTAIVVLALTAFACTTKIDFTGMGMYLYVGLIVLIMFGFFAAIFGGGGYGGNGGWMQLLYAGGGCLLFSFYLVYDTQLILGGQHKKYQFSVDDYVFAALNLYLDIINLFIFILQILGSRD